MDASSCPKCGQEIPAAEARNGAGICPACEAGSGTSAGAPPAAVCPYCLSALGGEGGVTACPGCGAVYHEECWRENGGCGVYGCSQAPPPAPRQSAEIPPSFWGQENKPCPACGREILAAAVRCRHCGATFASAQPEDAAAFNRRAEQERRLPQAQRIVVWIFVLSVIPCLAPIGGVWGLVWYPSNRSDVEALPAFYSALCKIGIAVGLGQTGLMALMAMLYGATH
jgi:hypothetical protein